MCFVGRKNFIYPPNTLKDAKISKTKIGWFVLPRQKNQFSFFFWCHFVCFVGTKRKTQAGRMPYLKLSFLSCVSWAQKEKTQSRNAESAINHLSRRSPAAVGRRRISGYALTRRGSGPPSFCLSWRVRPLSAAKKFPPRISWRTQQDRGCNSDRACA